MATSRFKNLMRTTGVLTVKMEAHKLRHHHRQLRRHPHTSDPAMGQLLAPLLAVETLNQAGLEGLGDSLKQAYRAMLKVLRTGSRDLSKEKFKEFLRRTEDFERWHRAEMADAIKEPFSWDQNTEAEWKGIAEDDLHYSVRGMRDKLTDAERVPALVHQLFVVPHPKTVDAVAQYRQHLEQIVQPLLVRVGYEVSQTGNLVYRNGKKYPEEVYETAWLFEFKGGDVFAFYKKFGFTPEAIQALGRELLAVPFAQACRSYVADILKLDADRTALTGEEGAAMRASVAILYNLTRDLFDRVYIDAMWSVRYGVMEFYRGFDGDEYNDLDD